MPARTRCSPAVSWCPSFSSSRPSCSCTAARLDHAAHQSSQRSSAPVTSSKSASSTPFETKRGSQCEIADVTLESRLIASLLNTGRLESRITELPKHKGHGVDDLFPKLNCRAAETVTRLIVQPQ